MDHSIKLYALYEDLDWFPIASWPSYLQEMAMSSHLNNRAGYRFFLFLVGNGFNPTTASRYLRVYHSYDEYQSHHLLKQYKAHKLSGTYWDLQLNKSLKF